MRHPHQRFPYPRQSLPNPSFSQPTSLLILRPTQLLETTDWVFSECRPRGLEHRRQTRPVAKNIWQLGGVSRACFRAGFGIGELETVSRDAGLCWMI